MKAAARLIEAELKLLRQKIVDHKNDIAGHERDLITARQRMAEAERQVTELVNALALLNGD